MAQVNANVTTEAGTVVVREVETNVVELQVPAQPAVVEVVTPGPQGPPGPSTLSGLSDVDTTGKVNQSVLYYDADSGQWKGDDINTVVTITDGGNW